MIAFIANSLLVITVTLSLLYPLFCYFFKNQKLSTLITTLTISTLSSTSFLILIYSHLTNDFSLLNVYQNSHSMQPIMFRIGAVWGNHEGSLLMLITILNIYTMAFSLLYKKNDSIQFITVSTQLFISSLLTIFLLLTSNPFAEIIPKPSEGLGFNPLLQDIALTIHPPILYIGYIGFSIPFSIAIAKILSKSIDTLWISHIKSFALFSTSFLSLGIGLGAWWAYRELGWGGYWFWDPVENASLIPWLSSIVLIHSLILLNKHKILLKWSLLSAISTFSFCLIGTFLTRAGLLNSVHSFSDGSSRSPILLVLISIIIIPAFIMLIASKPQQSNRANFSWNSKTSYLLINNLLFITACITVLIGTIYPVIFQLITNQTIFINTDYYSKTFNIIMLAMIPFMAIAPYLNWKKYSTIPKYCIISFCISLISIPFTYNKGIVPTLLVFTSLALGISVIIYHFQKIKTINTRTLINSHYSMIISHMGIALLILGLTISSYWKQEKSLYMKPTDKTSISRFLILMDSIEVQENDNYKSIQGIFKIFSNKSLLGKATPEIRFYIVEQVRNIESSIHHSLFTDIYIIISEYQESKGFLVRIYIKPGMQLIWIGIAFLFIGSLITLKKNRLKYKL